MSVLEAFTSHLDTMVAPKVLELGTKQWVPGVSTHHRHWLPDDAVHTMSDVEGGADVDVVADAHDLAPFEDNTFDAFIAISVWEHLRKPWIAADTAARVLKPGGILMVATHFAFPVHGYPSDYGRWTDVGLEALFDAPLWRSQKSQFLYPCTITPPAEVTVWNTAAPAYLNVEIFAIKN